MQKKQRVPLNLPETPQSSHFIRNFRYQQSIQNSFPDIALNGVRQSRSSIQISKPKFKKLELTSRTQHSERDIAFNYPQSEAKINFNSYINQIQPNAFYIQSCPIIKLDNPQKLKTEQCERKKLLRDIIDQQDNSDHTSKISQALQASTIPHPISLAQQMMGQRTPQYNSFIGITYNQFHKSSLKDSRQSSRKQQERKKNLEEIIQSNKSFKSKNLPSTFCIFQPADKHFNQTKTIQNFLESREKVQQIRKARFNSIQQVSDAFTLFEKMGEDKAIKLLVDFLYMEILGDEFLNCTILSNLNIYLQAQFKDLDVSLIKANFRRFLGYITGKNIFYLIDILREKHLNMNLKNSQFDQFKAYMINSFLKVINDNRLIVFNFSAKIEGCRYLILNKSRMFAQVYNQRYESYSSQKDVCDGVLLLAQNMYQKIFNDLILCDFFKGIAIDDQAQKFASIMQNIMNWDSEKNQVGLSVLRKFHAGLHISHVHLVAFKQHLIQTLRELKIKESEIYMLATKMDGFKYSIVNEDSFKEIVELDPDGQKNFISKYFSLMLKDRRAQNMIELLGKKFVYQHCEFIYYQFTNKHAASFTDVDLAYLHSPHKSQVLQSIGNSCPFGTQFKGIYRIQNQEIDAYSQNFMVLAEKYFPEDQIQLIDMKEQWSTIKTLILEKKCVGKQIGQEILGRIQVKLSLKLQQTKSFHKYFMNTEYPIDVHIKRIITFIFYNYKYYKQSDLKIIHDKLGYQKKYIIFIEISQSAYDLFIQHMIVILEELQLNLEQKQTIIDQIKSYRDFICSFQKEDLPYEKIISSK